MKRLHNIVHYVISKADYRKVGKTKLNKILWFADREFMRKHIDTITHSQYIKMPYGPVPKKIDKILKALEREQNIISKEVQLGATVQKSFISLKEPDISMFTPEEISILDKYIYGISEKFTASEISEISHDEDWESAEIGEVIPVETIFGNDINQDVTPDDIEEAKAFFDSRNSQ